MQSPRKSRKVSRKATFRSSAADPFLDGLNVEVFPTEPAPRPAPVPRLFSVPDPAFDDWTNRPPARFQISNINGGMTPADTLEQALGVLRINSRMAPGVWFILSELGRQIKAARWIENLVEWEYVLMRAFEGKILTERIERITKDDDIGF